MCIAARTDNNELITNQRGRHQTGCRNKLKEGKSPAAVLLGKDTNIVGGEGQQ